MSEWPVADDRKVWRSLPAFARRAGVADARITAVLNRAGRWQAEWLEVRFTDKALAGINWHYNKRARPPYGIRYLLPHTRDAKRAYDDPANSFWREHRKAR